MNLKTTLLALAAAVTLAGPVLAAGDEAHIEDVAFAHEGPFGKYDRLQLQRGLQVYTEICASCHGLQYVAFRNLQDLGYTDAQVRAYAANFSVPDTGPEASPGDERPAEPVDHFPKGTYAGAPDLSLMAKARAGFHGPYGTGINQLLKGMGGPEYIHAILTGYTGEEKEEAGTIFYENHAFPGGWIAMPPPLSDDMVTYADESPTTLHDLSMDVAAFLMWTAEPKLDDRKSNGLLAILTLVSLTVLLYLTNKKLWAPYKGKHA
jgi:ubiquinol-cytochrome c reductase cytochrome c1 subunit